MPAYHYVALNQNQQELAGVIEAPDEPAARQKLNGLGLSVVSLAGAETFEGAEHKTAGADKLLFEFEAFDKNGKKIMGTIVSESAVKAYARLFSEYKLNVISLFTSTLSPKDKEEARKMGISSLHAEYEKLYKNTDKEKETSAVDFQKKEREELLEKVDFTTKSVEKFLMDYASEIRPEEREIIQSYINQLARIKESTNLEHIRTTCERMLEHIQKQELFLHEDQKLKESSKIKIETKELLGQLKSTGLKKEINIEKIALDLKKIQVLRPFANLILSIFSSTNPAIRALKDQIKVINHHIISYINILLFGKKKILRLEAWESIKTLNAQKKRLKMEIKALKMGESNARTEIMARSLLWENVASVLGWVLAFYILAYFISYPFTSKQLFLSVPRNLYFYSSSFPKLATIFLFIAYAIIQTRVFFFKKNLILNYVFAFAGLFGFILIVINLM